MPDEANLAKEIFVLRNGVKMPAFGLGTFRVRNPEVIHSTVDEALAAGYRLFDTAAVYQNEVHLGRAFKQLLPKYGLTREDVFIITKLAPHDLAGDLVRNAFQRSLENLDLEYIDLYLIHFPGAAKIESQDKRNMKLRVEAWKEFEKLYNQGKVKSIGVSNFTLRHLQHLAEYAEIQPMVNQVEWHPYYHQDDLLQYCENHGIRLQAYCPFGGLAIKDAGVLQEDNVKRLSLKHNVNACQLLLAWIIQRGVAVIPKSTNPQHIQANIEINIRLTPEELSQIDSLGSNKIKYAWDPELVA